LIILCLKTKILISDLHRMFAYGYTALTTRQEAPVPVACLTSASKGGRCYNQQTTRMQMDGFPLSSNRQERLFPGVLSGCPTTGKPRQGSGTGFLAPVMEFIPPTTVHGPERIGKGTIIPAGRKQHIAVDTMGFLLTVVVHSAGSNNPPAKPGAFICEPLKAA
jgi:hypothetical protein